VHDRVGALRDALSALEARRYAEVAPLCWQLLQDNREDIEALLLLGLTIGAQGDVAQAAPLLHRVALARRNHAHPARDLAKILLRDANAALVAPLYRACLTLAPGDRGLHYAFADFLRDSGEPQQAVALLQPLLQSHATDARLHYEIGLSLAEAGAFANAEAEFRAALATDPGPAEFWANLGMMLKVEGRFDEALDAYDAAIQRAPRDARIRVNRAVARLHAGRLAEAWEDEAWRLTSGGGLPPETRLPPLSRVDVNGRTVLVVQEEGFGDTLQFLRYLPLLAARGARVVTAVPAELRRLMQTIPGVAEVPALDAPVPAHDYHCSFNSLPRVFETTLDTIPADIPYLFADAASAAAWAEQLPSDGLRVGLVWAGQARPWLPGFVNLDRRRGIDLAMLAPLADIQGVRLVSLQKGSTEQSPFPLFDPMQKAHDFTDTAAIVANLDLVISVDTSVAHLAGAMGKPVFMLDRYDNCWRWLSGRDDSPWYPTLRIFRQRVSGAWGPVVERVAIALAQSVIARGAIVGARESRSANNKIERDQAAQSA
jgi:Flp pilus assembly protein TadD